MEVVFRLFVVVVVLGEKNKQDWVGPGARSFPEIEFYCA